MLHHRGITTDGRAESEMRGQPERLWNNKESWGLRCQNVGQNIRSMAQNCGV